MSWTKLDPCLIGKVIHPFNKPMHHGLKLSLGDTVIIKSKYEESDWYYGYSLMKSTPKSSLGIFPCNYVKILGKEKAAQDENRNNESSLDDVKSKMLNIILVQTNMWITEIISLQKDNNMDVFNEVEIFINKTIELFYEIANWSLGKEKLINVQHQLFVWISAVNNLMNCDTSILTNDMAILSVANLPIGNLEELHTSELRASSNRRNTISNTSNFSIKPDPISSKHLQIVVENFEFLGCSDEILLLWSIIDTYSDLNIEWFWQSFKEVRKGRPQWMGEKFVFKAIPCDIRKDGFYLVVFVYRFGQLLSDPNKQLTGKFRRPIGFGSYHLKEMASDNEKAVINFSNLGETDFLKPTKEILKMKFPAQTQNRLVQFSATISDQSSLSLDAFDENHILESILLRDDKPYETDRHCLYIRLECAEFDRANKTSARNVEAQMCIKSLSGEKQACLCLNRDLENSTDYYSSVTYHCNSPRWKDVIKVNLKAIKPDDCHLLIDFYHCTTKDKKGDERKHFGSCFLRFIDFFEFANTTKTFSLNVQKISHSSKQEPKKYLNQASMISTEMEKSTTKEYCKITLILSSTQLSTNKEINEFLTNEMYEEASILKLNQYLKEVQKITNEDFLKPKLRKNITNLLKSYFLFKGGIINEATQIDLFVTWQLLSAKFIKFGLLEELLLHLKGNFHIVNELLNGVQYTLQETNCKDFPFHILSQIFGSLRPIFMVLASFKDPNYNFQISEQIKELLRLNLYFFHGYRVSEASRDARKLIFDCFIENLKYIQEMISTDVLIEFFNNLFESVDFLDEKVLPADKLDFISSLIKSKIQTEYPDLLVIWFDPTVSICTKLIDVSSNHTLQASEILLSLFGEIKRHLQLEDRVALFSQNIMKVFFERTYYVFSARHFRDLQKSKYIPRQDSDSLCTKPRSTTFLGNNEISSQEGIKLYTLVFSYLEEWCEINCLEMEPLELIPILRNLKMLIELEIYPKRWLSMHLKISDISARILRRSAKYMQNQTDEAFNKLIPVFFEACYTFIMQNCLQLQNFSLAKTQMIMSEYGDLRIDVMECFLFVWKIKPSFLDSFDKNFTVQTTMRVLNISFRVVSGIRIKTIPLLVHTISNWLDKCNDKTEVQRDIISETEILLRDGHGDQAFYDILSKVIRLGRIAEDVSAIIESFTNLINLHLEYRQLASPSSNVLHCQFLLYAFMKFYQDEVNIFTHFQHYSNKFSELLEREGHYFEATLVLKQQYDYMYWNTEESEFDTIFYENFDGLATEQQKEQLRKKLLDLLSQTKEYEYAADLCKELYEHYIKTYNYKEITPLMNQWAKYYDLIMTEPRLKLNYYRVTFIGGTLPSYMKAHRDYIVKGSIWFKLDSIKTILQEAFPDAEIQFYQSTPPTESPYEHKMAIYLAKMEPVPLDIDFNKNRKISPKIREFFKDHRIIKFTSDHPFHKGVVDKDNEIKSLHICRVTAMSEIMMPNLFMWNPVVHEERKYFVPIEVAIDTVLKKNQIIIDMIDEYEENSRKDIRPFTMLLNGTLDAGVNGGMAKYIEAFFNENNDPEPRINVEHINCFREVLIEQKNVLTEALILHKKLIPPQIQPMQERLEECLVALSKSVMDLNVLKSISFSNMRSLSDVYQGTSDLSFDSPSNDKEFPFFRDGFVASGPSITSILDDANRSSGDTTSSCNTSNCNRTSNSESDKQLFRDSIKHRKVSSTDEETLSKLASDYLSQMGEIGTPPIVTAVSTPEIRVSRTGSSLESCKNLALKSPPLPPDNEKPSKFPKTGIKIWKNWTLRSKSKEIFIGNTTKISLDSRKRPKLSLLDPSKHLEAE